MRQIDRFILHIVHNLVPLNEYSDKIMKTLMDYYKQEADDLNISITDNQLKAYIERFDRIKSGILAKGGTELFKQKGNDIEVIVPLSKLIKTITSSKGAEVPEEIDITPDVVYNNDDNTEVIYNGSKEGNCVRYGNGEKWCITRGSYGNYRYDANRGYPTFYLARNSNLDVNDPLSFVAIQVRDRVSNNDRYVYTNRKNQPHESRPMSFETLVNEVPWLKDIPNLRSILKHIPLSTQEKITQKYSRDAASIREWINLPFAAKEQYLVARKGTDLFKDISNDEFVAKYLPKYPQLATFIAINPDIIDSIELLKNLGAFSPNDRKSVTENIRQPINLKYLSREEIPFDVKKLLVNLNKWDISSNERLYVTKDGNAIVKLTLGDNIKAGLYTEEDDYPDIKINQRTSKYLLDYPEIDKIPFNNLLKLAEDGIISKEILDKVLEQAKSDPNSAIIVKDTDQGQIIVDTNAFTAYELLPNGKAISIPFDNEEVTKILEDEKDNEGLQDNALGPFKDYRDIPETIDERGLKSIINSIPYDKRIVNVDDIVRGYGPLVVIPTEGEYSFIYMPSNPNNLDRPVYNTYFAYGNNDSWRSTRGGPTGREISKEALEDYFAYLRNENITLDDDTLKRTFKGSGYASNADRRGKVAFVEANPPTSSANQFAPVMYNGIPLLVNKTNPRESFKVSDSGKMTKANISNALARQLLGTAATPEAPAAAAQAAGERRRGRPAGGAAQPRPQGPTGDVSVADRMREAGLGNGFTALPRGDFNRLNIDNATRVPTVNNRGASRRNNLLGNAGQVASTIVTPGGSAIYLIRLADQQTIASINIQPGNRNYLITPTTAVYLNSPTQLLNALQQRGLAENIKKLAAKFYLEENPHRLNETVNILKQLKEITVKPKTPQQYYTVKLETNPYINLNVSFLEDYINEFLEVPYEYANDLQDFITTNKELDIDTNTITLPNFVNYLVDGNFENWFDNDFKEIKYILSLKDVSSINEYIDKKAKELSKNNPEDFKFYQAEIKDIVLKLKEQLPLFLKTVELLKGKYTILSSLLDYFNSIYSILLYSEGNDLKYIAVDKNLGYFDTDGNIQINKEIYDKIYKGEDYELDELKVYPTPFGIWSNAPAPALYDFVKNNTLPLLTAIKNDLDKDSENPDLDDEFNFRSQTGIKNINNVVIDTDNYWEYLDENGRYPNGQEIAIADPTAGECEGVYISNIDNEIHSEFGSGLSFEPIPGFPGLYYDNIWC